MQHIQVLSFAWSETVFPPKHTTENEIGLCLRRRSWHQERLSPMTPESKGRTQASAIGASAKLQVQRCFCGSCTSVLPAGIHLRRGECHLHLIVAARIIP